MTLAMHLVMIVEDDQAMGNALQVLFRLGGFRVVVCDTVGLAQDDAQRFKPDLVIVDRDVPNGGVKLVIGSIRSWSQMPIIVLSADADENELAAVLDCGADDYVVKPFSTSELMARVRSVLRRYIGAETPMGVLQLGYVSIDLSRRTAHHRDGRMVRLTPLEHRVLETLTRHPDKIVTHRSLLQEVWGAHRNDSQGLRVHIASLRRKLEQDPSQPKHIITETGVGYRLVVDSHVQPAVSRE
jgi:two-component system, OmpR family, KDP operon response regulator KdpE